MTYLETAHHWLNNPVTGWDLIVWALIVGGCWWVAEKITNIITNP